MKDECEECGEMVALKDRIFECKCGFCWKPAAPAEKADTFTVQREVWEKVGNGSAIRFNGTCIQKRSSI